MLSSRWAYLKFNWGEGSMELHEVSEIENKIAAGEMTATQVFTQMKRLVYRAAPCYAFCEKTAFKCEIERYKTRALIAENAYAEINKKLQITGNSTN